MFLIIAGVFILLAYILRSVFWQIMSGLVAIAAGIEFISQDPGEWIYIIVGSAVIAVGIYQLIMVGVDLLKGD